MQPTILLVSGGLHFHLEDDLAAAVQTGGAIARLGQRLIAGVAKMIMDRFFACLQSRAA